MKQLKLLCIADHVDPLIYCDALKKRYGDVDAVLSCGDLKRYYYEFIVTTLNVPFYYVLGNHSPFSLERPKVEQNLLQNLFQGGILTDGRSVYSKKLDLIIVGFGGSINYNNGPNQYTESEMFFRIIRLLPTLIWNRIVHGRYVDILMTHAPPRYINDKEDPCHKGFKIFRWFLKRFKPSCMIHGHVHLFSYNNKRTSTFMDIPIINVYDHFILNIPLNGGTNE
ncbi:MAG: metallophosphoesterase [Spirochaetales bacterium]|nr:metallophosphoesterase [Spirochaetales bacterium]